MFIKKYFKSTLNFNNLINYIFYYIIDNVKNTINNNHDLINNNHINIEYQTRIKKKQKLLKKYQKIEYRMIYLDYD